VVPGDGSPKYCVVAGERRIRAARLAGLNEVPTIVCTYEQTEALKIALLENIQRENLGPIEEAEAFQRLLDGYGATQEELATMLGKKRSTVANSLRLITLEDTIKDLIQDGALTRGHAKALLGMPAGRPRLRIARLCVSRGLSVRDVERRVQAATRARRRRTGGSQRRRAEPPEIKALRERAEQLFGSPVEIARDPRSGAGHIRIKFYSDNDLERLLSMLGVNVDLS
jgi:ParB family chromosome partitioning protein